LIFGQKENKIKDIQFKNYENSDMFLNIYIPSMVEPTFNEDILGSFHISIYYPDIIDNDYRFALSMDNNPKNEILEEQFSKYIGEDSDKEIIEQEKTSLANFPAYKILWEEDNEKVLNILVKLKSFLI